MASDQCLRLNVGGKKHKVLVSTLLTYPETPLGALAQRWKGDSKEEIFFDRNPDCFTNILDVYRSNMIVCPPGVAKETFDAELQFWGFPVKKQAKREKDFNDLLNTDKLAVRLILEDAGETMAINNCATTKLVRKVIEALKVAIVTDNTLIGVTVESDFHHLDYQIILGNYFRFTKIVKTKAYEHSWITTKAGETFLHLPYYCTEMKICARRAHDVVFNYMEIHDDGDKERFIIVYECHFSL